MSANKTGQQDAVQPSAKNAFGRKISSHQKSRSTFLDMGGRITTKVWDKDTNPAKSTRIPTASQDSTRFTNIDKVENSEKKETYYDIQSRLNFQDFTYNPRFKNRIPRVSKEQ